MSDAFEPEYDDAAAWDRLKANDESKVESIASYPDKNQGPIKIEWDFRSSAST
jgi:hypothetical protein